MRALSHQAGLRRWIRKAVPLVLWLLPTIVYWPTIFYRYGFRDDYAVLREAQDDPGKIMRVGAMQARPLYGALLEGSFRAIHTIDQLAGIRLLSTLLLGAAAVAFFFALRRLKWDRWTAALTSALLVLIPSAQILVGWAVAWPRCVAILLAIVAFGAAEAAFRLERRRPAWWAGALALILTSSLVYPTDTLFYLTLVAAGLWSRRRWSARHGIEWLVRHLVTLGIGLAAAFTAMTVTFALGWVPSSARFALEQNWPDKLLWFAREPLQNALALIALNHDGGVVVVHRLAALVGIVILAGFGYGCLECRGRWAGWRLAAVVLLLLGSFGVNLIAADHWPVYRVLLPLTMTAAVVLVLALLSLAGRTAACLCLLALVLPGIWFARHQTFELIAWPQGVELNALEAGAARVDPARHPSVFILTPGPEQRVARFVSWDEFGSLSTDSDWTPKEMLKLVLRERFPLIPEVDRQCTVRTGRGMPFGLRPDVVIDLQNMRSRW